MAEQLPSPGGPDVNRGPGVIAIAWVECSLAIIIVGMRLWSRLMMRNLGYDDWMMLFTLSIFIVWCSFVTYYASLGGFRHEFYLITEGADAERITFVNYIIQFVTTFSYAPAKTAVGLLVMRIIGSRSSGKFGGWRRWLIIGTLVLTWATTIVNCVMTYTQCTPAEALWNHKIAHTCWDPTVEPKFAIYSSSVNIFADAVLAFVPASLIWKLRVDLKKRVSLSILLGLGVIAAVFGIVKTTFLVTLSAHSDITWQTYDLIVWAGSELFVLIFCGSIPTLKPLWDRYVKGRDPMRSELTGPTKASKQSIGLNSYASNRTNRTTKDHILLGEAGTMPYSPHALHSPHAMHSQYSQHSQQSHDIENFSGIHATTDIKISSNTNHDYSNYRNYR